MFTAPHQFRQGDVSFQVYVFVLDAAPEPFQKCCPLSARARRDRKRNSAEEEVALLRR